MDRIDQFAMIILLVVLMLVQAVTLNEVSEINNQCSMVSKEATPELQPYYFYYYHQDPEQEDGRGREKWDRLSM